MKKTLTILAVFFATLIHAQIPNYVPTNGLVGWWPFTGNSQDFSANGNHGIVNGATLTTDRFNNINQAYQFNGTSNYIDLGSLTTLGNFPTNYTASAWIFAATDQSAFCKMPVLSKRNTGGSWSTLGGGGNGTIGAPWINQAYFFVDAPNYGTGVLNALHSTSVTNDGAWHFIVGTKNGTEFKLYFDGILQDSMTDNYSPIGSTDNMYVGYEAIWGFDCERWFSGKIDDIGIWNRALTQQEITNLYNAYLPPAACLPSYLPANGLVGYWPFCGNANDESGGAHHGIVTGATLTTDRFNNSSRAYYFTTDGWSPGSLLNEIYIPYSSSFSSPNITVSSWVSPENYGWPGSSATIINRFEQGYSNPNGQVWVFQLGSSSNPNQGFINPIILAPSTTNTQTNTTYVGNVVQLNTWTHVCFSFDGASLNTYVNGVLENTTAAPNGFTMNTLGSSGLSIGVSNQANGYWSPYKGKIDDIGIWNRALTQQEITNLYNASLPQVDPLTLYMDTVSGANGQQVMVKVRVKNFRQLLSAQTSIQFNPSVLTFVQAEQFGISSLGNGSFGTTQAANGIVSFAWSDPNLVPQTLADSSVLFALRFNVVGTGGQFSAITFTNSPTPHEFVDGNFNTLTSYLLLPGRVNVASTIMLSGRVKSETNDGIRTATVSAVPSNTTSLTDLSGNYSLIVPTGNSYTITTTKMNDIIIPNGVTTLDLLLIQRHILGTLPLNSPYKIIAADVNNSQTITSLDINFINSLILGNISSFPNNRLWAFVPSNHTFSNPANPFPYPSSRTYSASVSSSTEDFIAMRLGDVNNSYNPLFAKKESTDTVILYTESKSVETGKEVTIPVRVRDFKNISGFQFVLNWDTAVLEYVSWDAANAGLTANIGSSLALSGELRVNWIDPNASSVTLNDDTVLFNITFEAVGVGGTSTELNIGSSQSLPMEFYNYVLDYVGVKTQNATITVTHSTNIDQINNGNLVVTAMPNPFSSLVTLQIQSFQQERVVIEIIDLLGRVLESKSFDLNPSNQSLQIGRYLAAGCYQVRVSDSDGNPLAVTKVVKQ